LRQSRIELTKNVSQVPQKVALHQKSGTNCRKKPELAAGTAFAIE
jgi:hypothetical protein